MLGVPSPMELDKAILEVFVAESKEHLENIEEDLLTLEQQKEGPEGDLINKIFRAIHTVKGSGGLLGLKNLSDLAHSMETMLSMIRAGELVPNSTLIDGFLEGVDLIVTMLDDVENSDSFDISEVRGKIELMMKGEYVDEGGDDGGGAEAETGSASGSSDMQCSFADCEWNTKLLNDVPRRMIPLVVTLPIGIDEDENGAPGSVLEILEERKDDIMLIQVGVTGNDFAEEGDDSLIIRYQILVASDCEPNEVADILGVARDTVGEFEDDTGAEISPPVEQPTPVAESQPVAPKPKETPKPEPVKQEVKEEKTMTSQPKKTPPAKKDGKGKKDATSDTIRMKVDILDKLMMLAGELVLVRNQQLQSLDNADATSRAIAKRLDLVTTELQENIMRTRMQPLGNIFSKFTRIVRDLGKKMSKQIEISITGNEVELDRTIMESLADPLTHLIRNCCDHGLETPKERTAAGKPPKGHIILMAYHEGGQINIKIKDDGRGINLDRVRAKALANNLKSEEELSKMNDKDIMAMIFLPGFSTAEKVSDVSGRGVGMDVVRTSIEKQGGTIDINSDFGHMTEVNLRLPLTLAIIPCLIVTVGEHRFAIPQVNLEEIVCLYDEDISNKIECAGHREVYRLRNNLLPLVRLDEVLRRPKAFTDETKSEITEHYRKQMEAFKTEEGGKETQSLSFVVLKLGLGRFGLIVDEIIGTEEIVVTPMHFSVKDLGIYSGATVMGDGKVALILDVFGMASHAGIVSDEQVDDKMIDDGKSDQLSNLKSLILFKYGQKEQFAMELSKIRRIEEVKKSDFQIIGNKEFVILEGVSTQIIRLDTALDVSECIEKEDMFFLLSKDSEHPHGFIISNLVDIGDYTYDLDEDGYLERGVQGVAILQDKMTLLLDMEGLARKVEPEWYPDENTDGVEAEEEDRGPTPDPDIPGVIWA